MGRILSEKKHQDPQPEGVHFALLSAAAAGSLSLSVSLSPPSLPPSFTRTLARFLPPSLAASAQRKICNQEMDHAREKGGTGGLGGENN